MMNLIIIRMSYSFYRTMITHRFDRGPSVSRSSFQRACARIGLTILGHSPVTVKPSWLCCAGLVPSERERNDTEGPLSCQPPFSSFFDQFWPRASRAVASMPHGDVKGERKCVDCSELRRLQTKRPNSVRIGRDFLLGEKS